MTTTRETITVQSATTNVTFKATFPNADAAYDWIAARPFIVVEASDAVQEIAYAMAESGVVHCSLCDGVGHGQPGYGPCPLEERGWMDTFEEEARTFGAWI